MDGVDRDVNQKPPFYMLFPVTMTTRSSATLQQSADLISAWGVRCLAQGNLNRGGMCHAENKDVRAWI